MHDLVMHEVRRHFRPEFLNRLDDMIVFHGLGREHMDRIVEIQLGRLHSLLAERGLTLHLGSDAVAFLADRGYDPVYGARPLKRAIQTHVTNVLARQVLAGQFAAGQHLEAVVDGDALAFRAVQVPHSEAV